MLVVYGADKLSVGCQLGTSHNRTCKLQPAKIEILDLTEFLEDLENPRTLPKPFFIRFFIVALI